MSWNPFKNWLERIRAKAHSDGFFARMAEELARRQEIQEIDLQEYLDRPVIVIHEGGNPVVGYGRRIEHLSKARNPTLVVYDYASSRHREVLCFGVIMHYTEQRYNVLLRLTPEERWAFVATNAVGWNEVLPRESDEEILGPQQLDDRLHRHGFFVHLPEPGEKVKPLPKDIA